MNSIMSLVQSSAGILASSEYFHGGDILVPIRHKDTNEYGIWSIQVRLNNIGMIQIRNAMNRTHSLPIKDETQKTIDMKVIRTAVFFSKSGLVESIGTIEPLRDKNVHPGIWRVVNFDSRVLEFSLPLDIRGYFDSVNDLYENPESSVTVDNPLF